MLLCRGLRQQGDPIIEAWRHNAESCTAVSYCSTAVNYPVPFSFGARLSPRHHTPEVTTNRAQTHTGAQRHTLQFPPFFGPLDEYAYSRHISGVVDAGLFAQGENVIPLSWYASTPARQADMKNHRLYWDSNPDPLLSLEY